jgi:hypothetical protein
VDGQDDIPFGPPPSNEQVPLVVPDTTAPLNLDGDRWAKRRAAGKLCKGVSTVNGALCRFPHGHNSDYCYIHDPSVTQEERDHNRKKPKIKWAVSNVTSIKKFKASTKSVEEVMYLLSCRMDAFVDRFGSVPSPEVEETICDLIRTFIALKKCQNDEKADKDGGTFGLQRRQA